MSVVADKALRLRTLGETLAPVVPPLAGTAPPRLGEDTSAKPALPAKLARPFSRLMTRFALLSIALSAAAWVLGAWWVLECVVQGESFGAVQLELYKGALTVTHCTDRTFLPIDISDNSPDCRMRFMRYWSTWAWEYRWGLRWPWGTTRATGVTGLVPSQGMRSGNPSILSSLKAGRYTRLYLPIWFLMLGPLTPLVYFPVRRLRRRRAGHCQRCGYNLYGNVSGRCPECGQFTAPSRLSAQPDPSMQPSEPVPAESLSKPGTPASPVSMPVARRRAVAGPVLLCTVVLAVITALGVRATNRCSDRRAMFMPRELSERLAQIHRQQKIRPVTRQEEAQILVLMRVWQALMMESPLETGTWTPRRIEYSDERMWLWVVASRSDPAMKSPTPVRVVGFNVHEPGDRIIEEEHPMEVLKEPSRAGRTQCSRVVQFAFRAFVQTEALDCESAWMEFLPPDGQPRIRIPRDGHRDDWFGAVRVSLFDGSYTCIASSLIAP